MRGVTYIVTAINWNVGTAAVVLHLKRSKNIPALESASSLFFYTGFDGLVLTALAFIGASFFPRICSNSIHTACFRHRADPATRHPYRADLFEARMELAPPYP